jgi:hypothetical protein
MNRFTKSIAVLGISLTIPWAAHAQVASTTLPADLYQFLLQQQANQTNPFQQALSTTTPATTTPIEDVVFTKNAAPVLSPTQPQVQITDRNVVLGDELVIGLTSQKDALTPIDLFVLAFDGVGFPLKRVFLKTVFNEQTGVTKKYRITINEELLAELSDATSMRIGYCIGGCKAVTAKLILGKVILPSPATTPILPGTQQTF